MKKTLKNSKYGQALLVKVITVFSAVVGLVMLDQLLNSTTWTSALMNTIEPYVIPMIMITVIGAVGVVAYARYRRR